MLTRTAAASLVALSLTGLTAACSSDSPKPDQSHTTTTVHVSPSPITAEHSSSAATTPNAATVTPPGVNEPAGKNGTPRGHWPKANRADATSTALAAMTAAYAVDAKLDNSYRDAQRREAAFASPDLAHALTTGGPGLDTAFVTMKKAGGYVDADCTYTAAEGEKKDTSTTAQRTMSCTLTTHGGSADKQVLHVMNLVGLVKTGNVWQVKSVEPMATN